MPSPYPLLMGTSSSKLAPETAGKLQASTHFDKKEINQLYSSFIKECPSGRMSRDDLLKIYRQFFPFGHAAPFVDRLIKILASAGGGGGFEGTGGVDFADYVMGLSVISRGRLDEKLFWSFKFCDFDGDGWISKDDLVESIELIHQLMGNMFNMTIKNTIEPIEDINDETEDLDTSATFVNSNDLESEETFTPQNRAKYLFSIMDEDIDGKADYNDFKRVVLADAEIIRGFLVYDGVI